MTGVEYLLLVFLLGLTVGKSVMYILMKIYYGRLLEDRRTKDRRKR